MHGTVKKATRVLAACVDRTVSIVMAMNSVAGVAFLRLWDHVFAVYKRVQYNCGGW
jgi:hypothetical protein